jgi:hypothetical protein
MCIGLQWAMAHGLAMSANRNDLRGLESGFLEQSAHHLCVMAGNGVSRHGAAVQFVGAALVEGQQITAKGMIKGYKVMGQDIQVSRIVYLGKDPIHTI